MAVRFNESQVRPSGRNSMGVRGIRLRKDDEVIPITTHRAYLSRRAETFKNINDNTRKNSVTENIIG